MTLITEHTAADIPFRKRMVNADIFVTEEAVNDMIEHAAEGISRNEEIMGLLAGSMYKDDNGDYAIVTKAVTSGLISDDVSVRFDPSQMNILFDALDDLDFNYVVIGWYHSHLGIGCFMSDTDNKTHVSVFGDKGFAMVLDPVREEMKVFKGSIDGTTEASMVVIEDHTHIA
jgi:proteasome lid subunit RPN8/RPN11